MGFPTQFVCFFGKAVNCHHKFFKKCKYCFVFVCLQHYFILRGIREEISSENKERHGSKDLVSGQIVSFFESELGLWKDYLYRRLAREALDP